jgi:hypothetical protein
VHKFVHVVVVVDTLGADGVSERDRACGGLRVRVERDRGEAIGSTRGSPPSSEGETRIRYQPVIGRSIRCVRCPLSVRADAGVRASASTKFG